jgi:DNA sulfur modification protein DndC
MEARQQLLKKVLAIQARVNQAAKDQDSPQISLINNEELNRIETLIQRNTWPERWDGTEPRGDELLDKVSADGSVQPLFFRGKERSLRTVIYEVLRTENRSMTAEEIYETLLEEDLYRFSAYRPLDVIRSILRRHCENLDGLKYAKGFKKCFVMTSLGKYWIQEETEL